MPIFDIIFDYKPVGVSFKLTLTFIRTPHFKDVSSNLEIGSF